MCSYATMHLIRKCRTDLPRRHTLKLSQGCDTAQDPCQLRMCRILDVAGQQIVDWNISTGHATHLVLMEQNGPTRIDSHSQQNGNHLPPGGAQSLGILWKRERMPPHDAEEEGVARPSSALKTHPVRKCAQVVT